MVNFREFVTSSRLKVFGGRDAETNDELVWDANMKDILLHTDAPGSPFVNIGKIPSKKDVKEAAIFCAKYSQDWRNGKRDIIVKIEYKERVLEVLSYLKGEVIDYEGVDIRRPNLEEVFLNLTGARLSEEGIEVVV